MSYRSGDILAESNPWPLKIDRQVGQMVLDAPPATSVRFPKIVFCRMEAQTFCSAW